MTTSEPPQDNTSGHLPWARASLRVSSLLADREDFERAVGRLENVSGKVSINTTGDRRIWLDDCPLASDASAEDQIAWAVEEAEAVLGAARGDLDTCSMELWLGLAVGAQLGVVCDAASLTRLANLSIDLVLDLYSWD